MEWTSIVAIYVLIWVMTAFVMLPFGIKTNDEAGIPKIAGQADSAPVNFKPRALVLRATIVAALVTTLFVLNYTNGWIGVDDVNILAGFFGSE